MHDVGNTGGDIQLVGDPEESADLSYAGDRLRCIAIMWVVILHFCVVICHRIVFVIIAIAYPIGIASEVEAYTSAEEYGEFVGETLDYTESSGW